VILLVRAGEQTGVRANPYRLPTALPRWYVFRPMAHLALTAEEVRERLGSARRRKAELIALNGGDLPGADPHYRQQLVQELFFHLVGAIEVLAQLVNEARNLGLDVEDASARPVIQALPQGDGLRAALEALHADTRRRKPVPSDLYSDDGVIYRIWNYRHQVTHRGRQPFQFNVGIGTAIDFGPGLRGRWRGFRHRRNPDPDTQAPGRSAHFILDPREPPGVRTASMYSVADELERMLELISTRCEDALALI
jgi:hypothetical protein